jgi:NADH-quinone oxidoreductase subunit C
VQITEYSYREISNQDVISAIESKTEPEKIEIRFFEFRGQLFCEISPGNIKRLCEILNRYPELSFEYLKCITAVDYVEYLEMVYCLYSFKNNWSVNIKVRIENIKPEVDSVTGIYRGADWYEREMAEMFGINIKGHPNLKPLLLAGDEGGFPLRKNFEITWGVRQYVPPERFE